MGTASILLLLLASSQIVRSGRPYFHQGKFIECSQEDWGSLVVQMSIKKIQLIKSFQWLEISYNGTIGTFMPDLSVAVAKV